MTLCKEIALRWQTISKVKMLRTKDFNNKYRLLTLSLHLLLISHLYKE